MNSERKPAESKQEKKKQIATPPKRPVGRPPKLVLRIEVTPQNVARSLFGINSDKYSPKDNQE